MLVQELLSEAFGGRANPKPYNWRDDRDQTPSGDDLDPGALWNVYTKTGGLIRVNLPAAAARALLKNDDLIKKYGKLVAKKATPIKEREEREMRDPYPFHRDFQRSEPNSNWGLKNKAGKIIRQGMSKEAAMALSQRSELIKKYGPLRAIPVG